MIITANNLFTVGKSVDIDQDQNNPSSRLQTKSTSHTDHGTCDMSLTGQIKEEKPECCFQEEIDAELGKS